MLNESWHSPSTYICGHFSACRYACCVRRLKKVLSKLLRPAVLSCQKSRVNQLRCSEGLGGAVFLPSVDSFSYAFECAKSKHLKLRTFPTVMRFALLRSSIGSRHYYQFSANMNAFLRWSGMFRTFCAKFFAESQVFFCNNSPAHHLLLLLLG